MDRKEALISKLDLFSACRRSDIRWVAAAGDLMDLPTCTVLARAGKAAREFVVIVEGEATTRRADGTERTLGAGDYFGHDGLTNDLPHETTIETTTPVRALVFEARAFHGLLDKLPSVGRHLMRDLVIELREFDRRLAPAPRRQSARSLRALS